MINNNELYSFSETEEEITRESAEQVEEQPEQESVKPSKIIYQTITVFLSLILTIFVCKTDVPWSSWLRTQLHTAINASADSTFGQLWRIPAIHQIIQNSRNLIRLEHVTDLSSPVSSEPKKSFFRNSLWPPVTGSITKGFGWQYNPISRTNEFFKGVEISAMPGSSVYAVADGEIAEIDNRPQEGWRITINHGSGWKSVYSNLEQVVGSVGQQIKAGTIVAYMGKINNTVLRLELYNVGKPVDPISVL